MQAGTREGRNQGHPLDVTINCGFRWNFWLKRQIIDEDKSQEDNYGKKHNVPKANVTLWHGTNQCQNVGINAID